MKKVYYTTLALIFLTSQSFDAKLAMKEPVIVWQPSHQTDTGKDFSEALTCNGIVEAAMHTKPKLKDNRHHLTVGNHFLLRNRAKLTTESHFLSGSTVFLFTYWYFI